ncbi:hypothetical protein MN608_02541 [Microdochium nivale]|nr:hypothetical protein MN608_02541 [Microdochium nivale]
MVEVKELGEKIVKQKREQIILKFLSAIFFVLPVVGSVVGGPSRRSPTLTGCSRLQGILAGTGLEIYEIVKFERNELLAIFSLVLAPVGILSVTKMKTPKKLGHRLEQASKDSQQ